MCRKDIRELWRNNTGFWQMHIGEWKFTGGTNKRRGKGTYWSRAGDRGRVHTQNLDCVSTWCFRHQEGSHAECYSVIKMKEIGKQ